MIKLSDKYSVRYDGLQWVLSEHWTSRGGMVAGKMTKPRPMSRELSYHPKLSQIITKVAEIDAGEEARDLKNVILRYEDARARLENLIEDEMEQILRAKHRSPA